MPVAPTIYDIANLHQLTQAGQPLLDYLNQRRAERTSATDAERRMNAALALQREENSGRLAAQESENRFRVGEGEANRVNALKIVSAQEQARRSAAMAEWEAKYPKAPGENDVAYRERIGKLQAAGPNKIYREMLLSADRAKADEAALEKETQVVLDAEGQRRQKRIEALARADGEVKDAFKKAKLDSVPANVAQSVSNLRAQRRDDLAASIETAWASALAKYDTPDNVPYSAEFLTRSASLQKKMSALSRDAQEDRQTKMSAYRVMVDHQSFTGGEWLEFGGAGPGASNPIRGNPDGSFQVPGVAPWQGGGSATPARPLDAAGKRALIGEVSGMPVAPTASAPVEDVSAALAPGAQPALAMDGNGRFIPTMPGAGAVPRFLNPHVGMLNRGIGVARKIPDQIADAAEGPIVGGVMLAAKARSGLESLWSRGKEALFSGTQDDKVRQLFGQDGPELFERAKQVGLQRKVPVSETEATMSRALSGDQTAIGHVKTFFNYLRQERDDPIRDDPAPGPITPEFLLPQ